MSLRVVRKVTQVMSLVIKMVPYMKQLMLYGVIQIVRDTLEGVGTVSSNDTMWRKWVCQRVT